MKIIVAFNIKCKNYNKKICANIKIDIDKMEKS